MRPRSVCIALLIVFFPFVVGFPLFFIKSSGKVPVNAHLATDTRKDHTGMTYKGIRVDWTFYPDWEFKPLFFPSDEYLVFMFHYTNTTSHNVVLMPSYTFTPPHTRRYSSNEEIAMYIEDGLENEIKAYDETPVTFKIPPHKVKHYIVVFEKPKPLDKFFVDVDVWKDISLRIHYRKKGNSWENYQNEWIKKYEGRG